MKSWLKDIRLIEGRTLELLRTIPVQLILQRRVSDIMFGINLMLDLDLILVKERSYGRSTVHLYQMAEIGINDEH